MFASLDDARLRTALTHACRAAGVPRFSPTTSGTGEGHVLGMDEPTSPPGSELTGPDCVRIDVGHQSEPDSVIRHRFSGAEDSMPRTRMSMPSFT